MNGTIITSAICRKLHSKYPDISIYREHIEDGFIAPSYFVWTSGLSQESAVYPRMIQRHKIEVNYFPIHNNTSMYEELLNVGMALIEHLSTIDVEIGNTTKPVYAIQPTYSIIDNNTLQFSAEYRIEAVINDGTTASNMGDIDVDVEHK